MWNLQKRDEECRKLQDLLEERAAAGPEIVRVAELSEAWPAAQRAHVVTCGSCQEAVRDLRAGVVQQVRFRRDPGRPQELQCAVLVADLIARADLRAGHWPGEQVRILKSTGLGVGSRAAGPGWSEMKRNGGGSWHTSKTTL